MEIIIQEGISGTGFENISYWTIEKLEVTGTFVVKLYDKENLVGQTPFNPKTTIIIINRFKEFDDIPGATK